MTSYQGRQQRTPPVNQPPSPEQIREAYERLYGIPPPPPQQEVKPVEPEPKALPPAPEEKAPKEPERVFFD